jgi:hypothetical protein
MYIIITLPPIAILPYGTHQKIAVVDLGLYGAVTHNPYGLDGDYEGGGFGLVLINQF